MTWRRSAAPAPSRWDRARRFTLQAGRPRCYRCFNRETAERLGIDYDEPRFPLIVLEDADGTPHAFTIRSMLVPTGHAMEALERVEEGRAGYRFTVLGDFEADPWELFQRRGLPRERR